MNLKKMKLMVLCLLLLSSLLFADSVKIYVSKDGDDSWKGTKDKPFASIYKARERARKYKEKFGIVPEGINIILREGEYELPRTFYLKPGDSGIVGSPVVYKAYKNEKVLLSGGRKIKGWDEYKDGIFKADLNEQGLEGLDFKQLYYKGDRQEPARCPNVDPEKPFTTGFTFTTEDVEGDKKAIIHYDANVIDPSKWENVNTGYINIFTHHNYGNKHHEIVGVDVENSVIEFKQNHPSEVYNKDCRFYVYHIFEELDAPGEWFFDKADGVLYFWPMDGKKPADGDVVVPAVENLVQFLPVRNKKEYISNIRFENIRFGYPKKSAFDGGGIKDCVIAGCEIFNTGGRGLSLGIDSCDNQIISNDIHDTCGGGMRIGGEIFENHRISGNVIANNHIYNCALVECMEEAGIYLLTADRNTIAHNLIHDIGRWGVGLNAASNTVIEYNHIYKTNHITEDAGGINTVSSWGGWDNHFDPNNNDHIRGNVIRFNRVHNSGGFGRVAKWMDKPDVKVGEMRKPYFAWGIYLDLASSGTYVYGNIVYDNFMGSLIIGGGRDNLIENNIFVNGEYTQVYSCKWSERYPMHNNRIERNVIVYSDPLAHLYSHVSQHGQPWQASHISYDYNLIYNQGGDKKVSMMQKTEPISWDEFKEKGMDKHSISADPQFVCADAKDYRLKDDSPAYELGFEPIPYEKIGMYEDEYRKVK